MSPQFVENTATLVGVTLTVVTVTVLYTYHQGRLTSKNRAPLPPGPPARWFWESTLPSVNTARALAGLIEEYGPVITLRQGSPVTIVIGRVDAATEIMEKEGAALADRPRQIAASEMQADNLRLVLMRSGEQFRRFRKAAHIHLQPKAATTHQDTQMEGAWNVIVDILNDPKNHQAHVQRYAASIMLRMQYGRSTPTSNDDPDVQRFHQSSINFGRGAHPGRFLVDRIPWLKYIPGYGSELKEYLKFDLQLYDDQMKRVESEMKTGQGGPSWIRTLLEHVNDHGLSRAEISYLVGDLFGAGSDTTATAVTTMILAAACHPEAQTKIQEELDVIVGKDRMPTWNDSGSLPQVHAFVLETLRWRPIAPIGIAHRATRDIIWRGHLIPEGATVLGCHWAISHDPVVFPDPDRFDPQRWIGHGGLLRNSVTAYPFGFGRRVCPGQYLANKSLYINLALLLWSFRIVERPNAPIDRNDFGNGIVARVPSFEVDFIPRIEESRLRDLMSETVM